MSERVIKERMETLEKDVESLQSLPAEVKVLTLRVAGVESQIVQLRTEMADEFSAIRGQLKDGLEGVRTELREDIAALGRETAAGFLYWGGEMRSVHLKLDRLLESPRRRKR